MGGGPRKTIVMSKGEFVRNQGDIVPADLRPWANWYGADASAQNEKTNERPIVGIISDSEKHDYEGIFGKWDVSRG